MKRRLRKPDRDTERGVSNALHEAFAQIDQDEDAKMRRLIDQMKDFEGTNK
jgi:hypothetical protein